ncbi:MAG: hypothetical protein ACYDEY_14980 [Acidimicrobiales bacterium]
MDEQRVWQRFSFGHRDARTRTDRLVGSNHVLEGLCALASSVSRDAVDAAVMCRSRR